MEPKDATYGCACTCSQSFKPGCAKWCVKWVCEGVMSNAKWQVFSHLKLVRRKLSGLW